MTAYADGPCTGRIDVVLLFIQTSRIAANELVSTFDYNNNGRIDLSDLVRLFTHL